MYCSYAPQRFAARIISTYRRSRNVGHATRVYKLFNCFTLLKSDTAILELYPKQKAKYSFKLFNFWFFAPYHYAACRECYRHSRTKPTN